VKETTVRLHLRLAPVIIATAILAAWPSSALAQCADQAFKADGPPAWVQLVALEGRDCLGGPQDPTPVTGQVRKAIEPKAGDGDPIREAAEAGLQLVASHLADLRKRLGAPVLTELTQQVDMARASLGTGQREAQRNHWVEDMGQLSVVSLPLQASVTEACKTVTAACREQFDLVKEVFRVARLTEVSLEVYDFPVMKAHQKTTDTRALMWDTYFTGVRSQYPWELVLNGRRMADDRPEVKGVKFGFRDVPRDQIILLHPSVAFEYASEEVEGSRFSGIAIVELLGYNRWSWKADGAMGFAVGGSFILAMGDHANMDDIGLGGMLHLSNKWSVGVTFMGDKRTVLVSGDVAQLFAKVSALKKKQLMTGQ
jgi:hypothetical protein